MCTGGRRAETPGVEVDMVTAAWAGPGECKAHFKHRHHRGLTRGHYATCNMQPALSEEAEEEEEEKAEDEE
jgi:hypothetical protein